MEQSHPGDPDHPQQGRQGADTTTASSQPEQCVCDRCRDKESQVQLPFRFPLFHSVLVADIPYVLPVRL